MTIDKLKEFLKTNKLSKNFPKWILKNPNRITNIVNNSPIQRLKFQYTRTIKELLTEEKDEGNEQRGQITAGSLSDKDKRKRKFDGIMYSAGIGNIEGGPLISIIRDYPTIFYSDFLHRDILFHKIINNEYMITFEDTIHPLYKYFYDTHGDIVNKLYKDWPQEVQNTFLQTQVTSDVNIYYHEDMTKNLEAKSMDFLNRNDNSTPLQKIHSIESPINNYIKTIVGYRYSEYTRDGDNKKLIKNIELNYKKIRENSPLTLIAEKKRKNASGKGKGYDTKTNKIIYDRGYHFRKNSFIQLVPYKIGIQLYYYYLNFKKGNKYVNISENSTELENFIRTEKVTNKTDFEKKCKTFSKFYKLLHDMANLKTKGKYFSFGDSNILLAWMIFLELDDIGKFTYNDYNKIILDYKIENQIAKLFKTFKSVEKTIASNDKNNFFSHRKSLSTSEGQRKTLTAFFNIFFKGKYEVTDVDGNIHSWKIEKDNYINWNYKFHDPKRIFDSTTQSTSYDGENQNCWVLGVPVTLAQLHAHHSLYHDVGGRTDDESKNCVMILDELNLGEFKKHPTSSKTIEWLMKNQSDRFTSDRLRYWSNGGMEKLKEYENNINNYYWPKKYKVSNVK